MGRSRRVGVNRSRARRRPRPRVDGGANGWDLCDLWHLCELGWLRFFCLVHSVAFAAPKRGRGRRRVRVRRRPRRYADTPTRLFRSSLTISRPSRPG